MSAVSFKLEQAFAGLMPEKRYKKRLGQKKLVLGALLSQTMR